MRGITRSVTFEHANGVWRSRALHECGFMPIRGAGAVPECNIPLGDTGITIRIDDGQLADATALQHALGSGPAQTWTGIEVAVTGELDFWTAGTGGFFRLLAGAEAVERSGMVPPAFNWGAMGLLTHDSFAYLTHRPGRSGHIELGACGYGPRREQLTREYADRIRAFGRDRTKAAGLWVEVLPATCPPVPEVLMQIEKRSSRVLIRIEGRQPR
jgi:protein-L-isoaspartate(D-aspartate) O-methyltransferase